MAKNQNEDWDKDRGVVMHRLQHLEAQVGSVQDKLDKLTLKTVMFWGAVGGAPAVIFALLT